MSKNRRSRGEHRSKKRRRPDQVWRRGPITVARYGKNTLIASSRTAASFAALQTHLVARYPIVVAEIDNLVGEIAQLVSELPSLHLLQGAWWAVAKRRTETRTESALDGEDAVGQRMIDYIQSLIAAAPRATVQRDITENDWVNLRQKVGALFDKINHEYQASATAVAKATATDYDDDAEEFKFRAQIYWCNVRGRRYQVHEPIYLEEMFASHSAVFEELFGITAAAFTAAMTKLADNLAQGVLQAPLDLATFQADVMEAVGRRRDSTSDAATDVGDLICKVIAENGWHERSREILGRAVGTDAFDVQKVTGLPTALLARLSWREGEATSFWDPGDFRGWPLRVWPISTRPFISVNGRHFCFDHYSLFDNLYRCIQRIVVDSKPDYAEVWKQIQTEVSEELPFKYLSRILKGGRSFRPVYYPIPGPQGPKEVQWAELDGLLSFEDHLFVIEVKGGAFSQKPPSSNFPAYIRAIQKLLLAPSGQGARFLAYLRSSQEVPIFDSFHKEVARLRWGDFRRITVCPITLDPITEIAAQVQQLRRIGIDVGPDPVWALSIDNLREYADIFDNPIDFLHFVEKRIEASKEASLQLVDELDHLGLYLSHNMYAEHAKRLQRQMGGHVDFIGYRDPIDEFFQARLIDGSAKSPPRQKRPSRLNEIIDALAAQGTAGRVKVGATLLDLGGEEREQVAQSIALELARHPKTRRAQPLSIHGETKATFFCWSSFAPQASAKALDHVRSIVVMNSEIERLLVELRYSRTHELEDVSFSWHGLASIPHEELERLQGIANELRRTRLERANAGARSSQLRNAKCPCGSGRKYKKCCL